MADDLTGQVTRHAAEVYEELFVPALFLEWAARVADAAQLAPAKKFSAWRAGRECWRAKLLSVFSQAARSALSSLKVEVVLVGGREIGDEVCGPLVVSPGLEVSATNGPIVYWIINWIFGECS